MALIAGSSVLFRCAADATQALRRQANPATRVPNQRLNLRGPDETIEMDQLLDQYAAPHQAPHEGEIESGHVVAITELGVVVDLGGKTEGLIPAIEIAEAEVPDPARSRPAD